MLRSVLRVTAGIFSTDGKTWHDSRQLIRPQFIKDRVSDLDTFERHTSVLIGMLDQQGQAVDLRDLFFRYVIVVLQSGTTSDADTA